MREFDEFSENERWLILVMLGEFETWNVHHRDMRIEVQGADVTEEVIIHTAQRIVERAKDNYSEGYKAGREAALEDLFDRIKELMEIRDA